MSVRRMIRVKVKQSPSSAAPGAIAAAVLSELSDDELRDALRIALPYLVRDEVRKIRHASLGAPAARGQYAWKDPEPETLPVRATGPQRRAAAQKATEAAQAKREREQQLLGTPVALGKGRWKNLGDCTPEDLRVLSRQSRERAAENSVRAEGYARLADDMEASGIERVRDFEEVGLVRQVFAAAA